MTKTFQTKYPEIEVRLLGINDNAFSIMGTVVKALKEGLRDTYSMSDIKKITDAYREEAMSGDYDNLLRVTMSYVTVY